MNGIQLRSIGKIIADSEKNVYSIKVDECYCEALQKLNEFGRIHVVWWADKVSDEAMRNIFSCELPYAPGTRAGVFACRSEYRPNPLGLSTVGVVSVDYAKCEILLDYIDAFSGTDVIDIKPYIPVCDRAKEFKVPEWFKKWPAWIEDAGEFFSNEKEE